MTVVAEATRNGLIESVHHGRVCAPGFRIGDVDAPMFPRSAVKPLQAWGMLRAGLQVDARQLALACASHGGEPRHVEVVRSLLRRYGLSPADLRNTAGPPLVQQDDMSPSSLAYNCSGKHAAMLATCVLNGWPTEEYFAADHPLQQQLLATMAELCGQEPVLVGVDGCGAPAIAISLDALARGFAALRTSDEPFAQQIAEAMTSYPELVGDDERIDTRLMRALPGTLAKIGAEGVLAVTLPDGRALACKIDDGARRALPAVVIAALTRLDVHVPGIGDEPTYGHGRPIGTIRAAGALA